MVRGALVAVVVALALAPGTAAAAEPVARDCPGQTGRLATRGAAWGTLTVRGLGCDTARRLLRTARLTDGGQVRLRRWRCALTGLYETGGTFRCRRGGRGMRFTVEG